MAEGERGGPQGQARLRLPPTRPSPLARWVPPSRTVTWVGQPESLSQEKRVRPGAVQASLCVCLHLKDISVGHVGDVL